MYEAEEAFGALAGWPQCRNCKQHYEPYRHLLDPDTSKAIGQWCPLCEVGFLKHEERTVPPYPSSQDAGLRRAIHQIENIIDERRQAPSSRG